MTPQRIQLRRIPGWRKPAGAIVVARPSRWGNPYVIGEGQVGYVGPCWGSIGRYSRDETWADTNLGGGLTAEQAVELYRADLQSYIDDVTNPSPYLHAEDHAYIGEIVDALEDLRGHDLACWCHLDAPCHADVLLDLANR